jgi:DNA polymerase I-like protein with 3'-5' exonuclease and polymerase domains
MSEQKNALMFLDVETSPSEEGKDDATDPIRNKIDLIGFTPLEFVHGKELKVCTVTPAEVHPHIFEGMPLAGHNLPFDFKTLYWKGYKLDVSQFAHDTLVMATALVTKVPDEYLERYEVERRRLNQEYKEKGGKGKGYRAAKKHSLKILAPFFLGVSPFWENPDTTNDPEYLKKDVRYTKGLYEHFVPMMKKEGVWEFYNEKLLPWQRMTLEAELDGICIDLAAMAQLKAEAEAGSISSLQKLRAAWSKVEEEWAAKEKKELKERYDQMRIQALQKIKAKTPEEKEQKAIKTGQRYDELRDKAVSKLEPFNYASPSQLLWAFKSVLGYQVVNMEGDETTGASVLELLAAQGKEDIKALLEYKSAYKLAHSYFPSYESLLVNGRIHCRFKLHGTRTGRLSCADPNLQQVPPGLKKIFAAAEGNTLVSQDLSAIEPVLIAYFTEDANLCRILMNGEDFHGWCAVLFDLVGCRPEAVKAQHPNERYAAKQGDLSGFYGSGKNRLFTTLTLNGIKRLVDGSPLTISACAKMIYKFRDYFAESWEFKQMLDAELGGGNTVDNVLGRKFSIPEPADVYMKGFNRLIQSSASDLLLQGTHDCLVELRAKGVWARLRLLVHDNTVLECAEKDAKYVNERLCYHLTKFKLQTRHGLVPLKVEGNYGRVWKG